VISGMEKSSPKLESEAYILKTASPPVFRPPTEPLLIAAITALLLVPCFWQEHIQAGDLSSHLYNAWLARQIHDGVIHGLSLARMWNNILCDWAFESLLRHGGAAMAERVVVGSAVVIFFWGAFYLIQVITRQRPWILAPVVAMLSYGFILDMGFLNFYVSAGLCFWIVALLWEPRRGRTLLAAFLLVPAVLAHPLPVAWAAGVLAYRHLLRLVPEQRRIFALLSGLGLLGLATVFVTRWFPSYSPWEIWNSATDAAFDLTGVGQVCPYGKVYAVVAGGLLLLLTLLFAERVERGGLMADPAVHLWLLHLAAIAMIPAVIQFPQFHTPLTFVTPRLSLFGVVCICAMLGGARYRHSMVLLSALIAGAFFTFLYIDTARFNHVEDEVRQLLDTLPRGQRVAAYLDVPGDRINPLAHVLDRPCIGRCFDYGNYEAATLQFRVRAEPGNLVVASNPDVVRDIETGTHIVTPRETPLYSICANVKQVGGFELRKLEPGEKVCHVDVEVPAGPWAKTARGSSSASLKLEPVR
jgi:hypothetical protein